MPSLFFELALAATGDYMTPMSATYGQFCPVAKASEIFATRWTPLVLRELLSGACTFNDIHRGVPRMSRTLLSTRLAKLESCGVIERQATGRGKCRAIEKHRGVPHPIPENSGNDACQELR